jgi:hypothetical protein
MEMNVNGEYIEEDGKWGNGRSAEHPSNAS